jgi:hypothetical protein
VIEVSRGRTVTGIDAMTPWLSVIGLGRPGCTKRADDAANDRIEIELAEYGPTERDGVYVLKNPVREPAPGAGWIWLRLGLQRWRHQRGRAGHPS